MKTLATIIISIIGFFGCSPSKKANEQHKESSALDTNELMTIVENSIIKSLEAQHRRKTKTLSNDSRLIEFFEDTTNVDASDIIWEYYKIDRSSFIIGDLNKDETMDFAIRTTQGATISRHYQYKWHIFINSSGEWIEVQNKFGGGSPFNLETITKIENGVLTTNFQEVDEVSMQLKDSIEKKHYELKNNTLVQKK
jgi:hypothetical protein